MNGRLSSNNNLTKSVIQLPTTTTSMVCLANSVLNKERELFWFRVFRIKVSANSYRIIDDREVIPLFFLKHITGADLEGGAPGARPLSALICKTKK